MYIYINFISRSSLYKSIRPCINEKIEIIFLSELTGSIIVMVGGSIAGLIFGDAIGDLH